MVQKNRHCSPANAGDLDVAGPAWLRSYPDRGGPVINRGEKKLMRRASTCLAVLALAAFALPSLASAAPSVKLKAVAVPIPKTGGGTWAGTGNIYGAGAAVEAEYQISGTEYGGGPPPRQQANAARHRIRRVPTAGQRRELLAPERDEAAHVRVQDLPDQSDR